MLNYLVGKKYIDVEVYYISKEDVGGDIIDIQPMFFRVKTNNLQYDSLSMGTGEVFLIYMFCCIEMMNKNSILIIDEPETHLSVQSQTNFSYYLTQRICKNNMFCIFSTHSPMLLLNYDEKCQYCLRIENNGSINIHNTTFLKKYLDYPMFKKNKFIFVEDSMGKEFITELIKEENIDVDYNIEIVFMDGWSDIVKNFRDKKKMWHIKNHFICIFDEDQINNEEVKGIKNDGVNVLFIPCDKDIETTFKNCILNGDVGLLKLIYEEIPLFSEEDIKAICDKYCNNEPHDVYINIMKTLCIDEKVMMKIFYSYIKSKNKVDLNDFISSLTNMLLAN